MLRDGRTTTCRCGGERAKTGSAQARQILATAFAQFKPILERRRGMEKEKKDIPTTANDRGGRTKKFMGPWKRMTAQRHISQWQHAHLKREEQERETTSAIKQIQSGWRRGAARRAERRPTGDILDGPGQVILFLAVIVILFSSSASLVPVPNLLPTLPTDQYSDEHTLQVTIWRA